MISFCMDVRIKCETKVFNYCARAIIEQDGKILIIRVNDADYYHLPGGHVEIGETSKNALLRELEEETGLKVKDEKLVVIDEQFYTKKEISNHSLIFYYVAKLKDTVKLENTIHIEQHESKTTKHELSWVTRDELKEIDLRPELIKDMIIRNDFGALRHIISK